MVQLVLIAFIVFGLTTFFRRLSDINTLISVAIGAAINANIFTAAKMPVCFGGFVFGIDSILYTLFMFTVVFMAVDHSPKDAENMSISTVVAIIISAFIEVLANWYYGTLNYGTIQNFINFIISSIATAVGIYCLLGVYSKLVARKVNIYFTIFICVMIGNVVNSTLYYSGIQLNGVKLDSGFIPLIAGSYIGKIFCMNLGLLSYFSFHNLGGKSNRKRKKDS